MASKTCKTKIEIQNKMEESISYRETGERSSQKSVKYIVNLNSNEETRPTDKKRILCVLNNWICLVSAWEQNISVVLAHQDISISY